MTSNKLSQIGKSINYEALIPGAHTHPRDAECYPYPYEAANKIDDILKLRKAMLGSLSAGSAAMKGASQDAMTGDRERFGEEIGDVAETAYLCSTQIYGTCKFLAHV
jgi:hypothetical protein